ncbi:unnamed protein product [Haemonchus placei]|uniref:Secreted protein n=1 Tax=Haemonchus placei TaxID=6290 RepID=A0A0N4WII1_HAEPC|nr:unnamed protein product [Haemonchus placei]
MQLSWAIQTLAKAKKPERKSNKMVLVIIALAVLIIILYAFSHSKTTRTDSFFDRCPRMCDKPK